MKSGSGATDDMADKCIRAPGATALALALGDPAACRGSFLLSLNLSFQRCDSAKLTTYMPRVVSARLEFASPFWRRGCCTRLTSSDFRSPTRPLYALYPAAISRC